MFALAPQTDARLGSIPDVSLIAASSGLLAAAHSYSFSDPLVELIALKANAAAAPPSNSATM